MNTSRCVCHSDSILFVWQRITLKWVPSRLLDQLIYYYTTSGSTCLTIGFYPNVAFPRGGECVYVCFVPKFEVVEEYFLSGQSVNVFFWISLFKNDLPMSFHLVSSMLFSCICRALPWTSKSVLSVSRLCNENSEGGRKGHDLQGWWYNLSHQNFQHWNLNHQPMDLLLCLIYGNVHLYTQYYDIQLKGP